MEPVQCVFTAAGLQAVPYHVSSLGGRDSDGCRQCAFTLVIYDRLGVGFPPEVLSLNVAAVLRCYLHD